MRIIIYLGKGGVGKTSVSAATSVAIARSGKRVLTISTDVAHSLADAFGGELNAKPVEIEKNLFAMEVNILSEIREHWEEFHSYFSTMLMQEGASEIVADELAIMPGMEEMISLRHIWRAAKSGDYDVVVVDAAPTGETMRLLAMPESYRWYTDKIAGWHTRAMGLAAPLIQKFMPKKNIFKLMPEVGDHMKDLHTILQDPNVTSYRIVLNPENMVLKEALRAQTYLNLFSYRLDAVIVNKVMQHTSNDPYLMAMINQQKKYLERINSCFYPLPIFPAKYYSEEVIGPDKLHIMSKDIFADKDPSAIFYHEPNTQSVEKLNGKYMLKLYLPNIEIDRVQMNIKGDELLIEVNNFRKNIILPNVLVGRKTESARFEGGNLEVTFG
ncbi:MAG: ArsA family ATPase [Chlorobiales bacterium]|jgi:arsenite/tail-anchored protein-transporting ATPase|nr:ArsA family ATPase [Chlorobiales bacterium]